jgi:hypothetical protein
MKLSQKEAKQRLEDAEYIISRALYWCERLGVTVIACPREMHREGLSGGGGRSTDKIILTPLKLIYRHPDAP